MYPLCVQITCTPLTLISNYALLCVVDLIMQACIACNAYGKNFKSIIMFCMTALVMQYFALQILMRKFVLFMWRKLRLLSKQKTKTKYTALAFSLSQCVQQQQVIENLETRIYLEEFIVEIAKSERKNKIINILSIFQLTVWLHLNWYHQRVFKFLVCDKFNKPSIHI